MVFWVNLIIILSVWGVVVLRRRFLIGTTLRQAQGMRRLFAVIVLFEFALLFYLTRQQFFIWHDNDISKYLIPPYSDISYFIFYTLTRFWGAYVISLAVALIFLGLAKYFNKKRDYNFFKKEEAYFLAMALFLSGHPGWMLYFVLILTISLLASVYKSYKTYRTYRISLYHFWLPVGVLTIILNKLLLDYWEWYGRLLL